MVTKRFSSRLLITFLICVFAFCSTGFLPGRFTLPVTRAVAAPPVVTGTINIWYSYGALDDSAFQIVLNNARAAFPSATINAFNMDYGSIFSDYNSAVQGGGGPDLFLWTADVIGDMARSGTIQNLDGPLSGRLSAYDSFAIEEITVEGHLYGVPKNSGGVALYYNKSTIATPPDDITDLYNLVDGGKKLSISMDGGAYYNFGLFAAFGGQLFAPNGYCIADQGGFVPAMQYWSQLKDAGATVALNYWNEGILAFRAGDLDMLIDGPWNLVDHENALGVDLGVAVLPEGPVGKSAPFVGVDAFFVNPNTSNLASAVEVALYMTSQPSMQTFTDIAKQIPVRDDVVAADPLVNIFADAAEQSYIRPSIPELGNYWVPFS